jgi:hypothetical protein
MAVIDLGTGAVSADSEGQAQPTSVPGNIIDLETGQFVAPTEQALAPVDQVPVGQAPIGQAPLAQPAVSPFPEERGETRAAQELPELGAGGLLAGEDQLKVGALSPVLLATTDTGEIANILTKNFPNIGIAQDPGGNLIARNNRSGAQVILNAPGISQLDVLQGLGIIATFTPAGRLAAIPATVGKKAITGAVTSGLTQAAIEGIQSKVGGELNEEEVALAAALGGVAETVVPAIQSIRQSRQASKLDVARGEIAETVERIRPAREAQAAVQEATGVEVPLFQAQQTLQPSTLLKQRLVPQLDAGAKKAAASLEQQNKQAFDATSELINTIAPAEVVATGARRFRTAAQTALEAGKQRRSEAVRPLFEEALNAGGDVDLKPVTDLVEESLRDAPKTGKIASNINKVKDLLVGEAGKKPTLRQLQKAKFEIDDMLEAFGENALGNTTKREVLQIQQTLVDQMEQASPLFKSANEEFKRLSPAVTELQDSIIGAVSKVDDTSLKNISRRIFDVAESNPQVVRNARAVIDKVDPGAWDDLMRTEFQRRFAGIETLAEDIPGELVGNVPGQLRRAIFGNPEQRRTLLAGMTSEQRKNFVYLDEVLRRASAGRQAGSPTAPFGEVLDRLKGTAGVLRDMILRPLESLQKTGERGLFDRNVSKLADVLFNPKWEPKLKQLRSLNPRSEKAEQIMSELINAAKAAPQITEVSETELEQQ